MLPIKVTFMDKICLRIILIWQDDAQKKNKKKNKTLKKQLHKKCKYERKMNMIP